MITVLFSCRKCGLVKKPVQVPAREHQDTDVVKWMKETVGSCVSEEHARLSPNCHPETISEVYVPTAGAEFIGQQVE